MVVEAIAAAVAAPLAEQRDADDGQPAWNDSEDRRDTWHAGLLSEIAMRGPGIDSIAAINGL